MNTSLALVSRPRPQLDALAARLEDAGVSVVSLPAFRFEATGETVKPDADWAGARTRLLVFTSPRAVSHGLPALGGMLESAGGVAAIGPATAQALAAAGIGSVHAAGPNPDTESLLERLEAEFPPGAAVILAAPGGRDALERGLRDRGWRVRLAPVYRRVPVEPDGAEAAKLEGAENVISFWTSGAALDHLLGRLSDAARERVLAGTAVVASERLAGLARARGFPVVRVAGGADNDALFEAFRDLASGPPPVQTGS